MTDLEAQSPAYRATAVSLGSVGCPAYKDDNPVYNRVEAGKPNEFYALIIDEAQIAGWDITFRKVPYDNSRSGASARSHGATDWASARATSALPPV